jgi:hypothetical protein
MIAAQRYLPSAGICSLLRHANDALSPAGADF